MLGSFYKAGLLLVGSLLVGCSTTPPQTWYRGNTHTHTVICGHADSTPDHVAAWYHDRGYHFLILSEHNHFIDPATVNLPEPTREDFILIPGVELTGTRAIHSTSMNVTGVPPWKFTHDDKSKIIQNHVVETRKLGGEPILNHPNFRSGANAKHMLPVEGLHLFELFNGHPHVHSHGTEKDPSTEEMWDEMLTAGKLIYGVSSDDAHHFQTIAPDKSNPGRGWVMVEADQLDADTITQAIARGEFYASNGVFLKSCVKTSERYKVVVDTQATEAELAGNPLLRGKAVEDAETGYTIEFIGPGGETLHQVNDTQATFTITPEHDYVRARVTLTRPHPNQDGLEQYYAWGQPAFPADTSQHSEHEHHHALKK